MKMGKIKSRASSSSKPISFAYNRERQLSSKRFSEKPSLGSIKDNEMLAGTERKQTKELTVLERIGRSSMKAVGSVARKVEKFEREHPKEAEVVRTYIQIGAQVQEAGVMTVAKVMGKEKEMASRGKNLSKAFSDVQKDVSKVYSQKCNELGVSKEDQAGAMALSFGLIGATKARGGVKALNKAQRSTTSQSSLAFTTKEAVKNRQENIIKGIPESRT